MRADTAALCKAVEGNAKRMLGDLPSASELTYRAIAMLRQDSDVVQDATTGLRPSLDGFDEQPLILPPPHGDKSPCYSGQVR